MLSDAQTVADLFTEGQYNWVGEKKDQYCLSHTNQSSVGNRYISWFGLWAHSKSDSNDNAPGGTIVSTVDAHDHIKKYDWRVVFALIAHGVFVGPATQEALSDCVKMIEDTELPEEGGPKVRTWNGLVYVSVTERTRSLWELTDRVRKRMFEGFQTDKEAKQLLSDDWIYVTKSHSGWSRST